MKSSSLAQVKEIVSKIPLPEFVHEIEFELDEDHLGDPCVRIRLIVADEDFPEFNTDREVLLKNFQPFSEIENKISDAVIKGEVGLWPYTSIATETDRATHANLA